MSVQQTVFQLFCDAELFQVEEDPGCVLVSVNVINIAYRSQIYTQVEPLTHGKSTRKLSLMNLISPLPGFELTGREVMGFQARCLAPSATGALLSLQMKYILPNMEVSVSARDSQRKGCM